MILEKLKEQGTEKTTLKDLRLLIQSNVHDFNGNKIFSKYYFQLSCRYR